MVLSSNIFFRLAIFFTPCFCLRIHLYDGILKWSIKRSIKSKNSCCKEKFGSISGIAILASWYKYTFKCEEYMLQGKIWIHLWDSYMGQPAFHCIVDRASLIQTHDSHKRRTRWTSARETIRYRALKTPPLSEPPAKTKQTGNNKEKRYCTLEYNSKTLCKM